MLTLALYLFRLLLCLRHCNIRYDKDKRKNVAKLNKYNIVGTEQLVEPIYRVIIFKRFIYLFIFREGEGEKEGEKHQCVVASHAPPSENLPRNPGMCPDWESNQ